jgi:cytochrome b6-f complex iron-sulfur subunit
MDRRAFLGWIGVGMLASSLPVVIAACTETDSGKNSGGTDKGSSQPTPSARSDGFQALGTVKDLKEKGSLLNENDAAKPVLIFTNPNTQQIAALHAQCPHQGCIVQWEANLKVFKCPCHGSKFDSSGQVKVGPAKAPLTAFQTKVEGETILVKVV